MGGVVNRPGGVGSSGAPGTNGSNGRAVLHADGYDRGDSVAGTQGSPGVAGGGGGAGAGTALGIVGCGSGPHVPPCPPPFAEGTWQGASGAGGGAGGCPGRAAMPAEGGGASIAVFVDTSELVLDETTIEASAGGRGGAGSFGSAPSPGGRGGAPSTSGNGGGGGDGGAGGYAGFTGHGASGASYGIVHIGAAPRVATSSILVSHGGAARDALTRGDQTIPKTEPGDSAVTRSVTR